MNILMFGTILVVRQSLNLLLFLLINEDIIYCKIAILYVCGCCKREIMWVFFCFVFFIIWATFQPEFSCLLLCNCLEKITNFVYIKKFKQH